MDRKHGAETTHRDAKSNEDVYEMYKQWDGRNLSHKAEKMEVGRLLELKRNIQQRHRNIVGGSETKRFETIEFGVE